MGKKKDKTADTANIDSWSGDAPTQKKEKPASNTFDDLAGPGSGGNFTPEDYEDRLLLISPISLEEGITTSFGSKDAIKANIVILDVKRPASSEEIKEGLIFPKVLQGQLQQALSRRSRVVGTLIKDVQSQKPGQKPPWRLTAPSDADIDVAKSYLDSLN